MIRKYTYSFLLLFFLLTAHSLMAETDTTQEIFSKKVKIALRDAGNQLLLSKRDSHSLILPVQELSTSKYRLSFQDQFSLEPSLIVAKINDSFSKLELPKQYIVEVIQCDDREVAYSYEINNGLKDIIPCVGRNLPLNCYQIEVFFRSSSDGILSQRNLLYGVLFSLLLLSAFLFYRNRNTPKIDDAFANYAAIGKSHFDVEQSQIWFNGKPTSITKKECELLEIFTENINQLVKREELVKKVWEDHNVIVGRSLDTYISRLRGKLKSDDSIKIINVHGQGYKMQIN